MLLYSTLLCKNSACSGGRKEYKLTKVGGGGQKRMDPNFIISQIRLKQVIPAKLVICQPSLVPLQKLNSFFLKLAVLAAACESKNR